MYFIHIYSYRLSFRLIQCLCLACLAICQICRCFENQLQNTRFRIYSYQKILCLCLTCVEIRQTLPYFGNHTAKQSYPNFFFLINLVFMSRTCRNSSNIAALNATLAIILQNSRIQIYSYRLNLCFICPACFEIRQTSRAGRYFGFGNEIQAVFCSQLKKLRRNES